MNAPSRIFIHPTERCPVSKVWNRGKWKGHDSGAHGDTEYIRADLVQSLIQAAIDIGREFCDDDLGPSAMAMGKLREAYMRLK